MPQKYRNLFFLLFALSGFSGLIYESIWTHYLKLFLGHAAFAQTLVLAIFMGGMAIGSWLCARYSGRWGSLLKGYAVAEGVIGVVAIAFHDLFVSTLDLSYSGIIPSLATPQAVTAYKWIVSTLLILPQSILLGMTFPLMSAGILRLFPDRPGRSVALLYFSNSIGAVVGVLTSGFFLIRLAGLPGTVRIAGVINLVLAAAVWLLIRNAGTPERKEERGETLPLRGKGARLLLAASLVTGAASFIYEVGWIRMLSLVLGSSTHAFELMLSAFIFGLACGGLWLQRRIDRVANPVNFLSLVQVAMGLCALSTLVLYDGTFGIMQWLVENLEKTDAGYALFNLSSSAIAIGIMLPATFCAGLTLPLLTLILMKEGYGERSIGAVYAANTVGAIAGVFFAVHVGMPLLGLKGLITCGAILDVGLGIVLLWSAGAEFGKRWLPAAATVCGVGAVAAVIGLVELDLYKMGSGVYRFGFLLPRNGFQHLYHLDGKTATVDVFLDGLGSMRINTNGKTDATIMTDPSRAAGMDEATMTLLAAIPMALHPQANSAACIGLGSGMTSQVLLGNPRLRTLDNIEIEQGMVDAARHFRPLVDGVYTDPRSRIHVDDAKTFFSTHGVRYDLIISEPSNPWVSGVSGLFSEEFYRLIKNHLSDDGLFVQWVQLYEINNDLVISVLKAVSNEFSDFAIYAPDDRDLLIVAKKKGRVPAPDAAILELPDIAGALQRVQVAGVQDIEVRKVGDKKLLEKFLASYPIRANSDYYPVLDQHAARTRFLNESAASLIHFAQVPIPSAKLLGGSSLSWTSTAVTPTSAFPISQAAFKAMALRDYLLSGSLLLPEGEMEEADRVQAMQLKKMFAVPGAVPGENERLEALFTTADNLLPYLTSAEFDRIWAALEAKPAGRSLSLLDRQCLTLFKAIGRRDGRAIAAAAATLLQREYELGPGIVKYVVISGIIGELMQGDQRAAGRLWARYQPMLAAGGEPDLLLHLLGAESRSL